MIWPNLLQKDSIEFDKIYMPLLATKLENRAKGGCGQKKEENGQCWG